MYGVRYPEDVVARLNNGLDIELPRLAAQRRRAGCLQRRAGRAARAAAAVCRAAAGYAHDPRVRGARVVARA